MTAVRSQARRNSGLDGLRGWAALSVVVYHCLWQQFGTVFPQFANIATAFLGDGLTAVAVFLTLSGYVLTRGRWNRVDNRALPYSFARRYARLVLPVLVVTFVVYLLMSLHLTPTDRAFEINHRDAWYGLYARFQPDLGSALSFGLWRVFGISLAQSYNPFLWTLAVELWGSLSVFALSQHPRYLREPYSLLALTIVLALALFPFAAAFLAGAAIARTESDGWLFKREPGAIESHVATVAIVVLLGLGALDQSHGYTRALVPSLAGVGIFLAVKRSRPALRFLERPFSQWLGRLSFPLYLIQYTVVISISAYLMIWLNAAGALNPITAVLHAVISVGISLGLAQLLLPVEVGTLALLRRMDQLRLRWPWKPMAEPAE